MGDDELVQQFRMHDEQALTAVIKNIRRSSLRSLAIYQTVF